MFWSRNSKLFHYSTAYLYFQEDFSTRVDALRHHEQRRPILKAKEEQPIVVDNFDDPNADAVRSLYLDPDAPLPPVQEFSDFDETAAVDHVLDDPAHDAGTGAAASSSTDVTVGEQVMFQVLLVMLKLGELIPLALILHA